MTMDIFSFKPLILNTNEQEYRKVYYIKKPKKLSQIKKRSYANLVDQGRLNPSTKKAFNKEPVTSYLLNKYTSRIGPRAAQLIQQKPELEQLLDLTIPAYHKRYILAQNRQL